LSLPLLVTAILVLAYLGGITDSANVVAPVISSRALSPRRALLLTAAAASTAPFIFGLSVARAFGEGVIAPDRATPTIVMAATLSALVWRWLTWRWGLPSSLSHGLVGGLVGAAWTGAGLAAVNIGGLLKVLLALFISPAVGLGMGWVVTQLIYSLAQRATPRVNVLFRYGQIVTAAGLALSWGANDAQKTIGLLALAATVTANQPFSIPLWTVGLSVAAVALGTLTTGWRLIRTLGAKFYRIRPVNGLAAQIAAASVILSAAALGGPVSTTQVVSTSILGAGAAERVNKVRWRVAGDILWAWVLTLPVTATLAALGVWVLERVGM